MSNTKIAIDKEDFEQKIIGWIERRNYVTKSDILALFQDLTTEIQIDQSIEARAETILKEHTGCEGVYLRKGEHFGETVIEAMVELATSQQIIEQLRVKEKEDETLLDFIDWFGEWQIDKRLDDYGINYILRYYKNKQSN